ncbi:MAG: DUF1338 domain-containing protein [Deltaproteobacteria bacterium]|nr:DUF1338 domain-containing protein [Deltaproteobacteria bacterium]MCB9788817.1 DUF1338 domain-containing protein [Deltaproteobacteria bacterium]
MNDPIASLFHALWDGYAAITPLAGRIQQRLAERGETVTNDHIALRTFDLSPIGLERLAAPFLDQGYEETGRYRFVEKKLSARSYSHRSGARPRVFISELRTAEFSPALQSAARALAAQVAPAADPTDLLTAAPTWSPISTALYQALLAESEYAAWLAAFGIRANHFTVSVNALQTFADLSELNAWLLDEGFALNDAGGVVKGGPHVLLAQSSTWADRVPVAFADGTREIPSCYYEFALRYEDPRTGRLFDGFVEGSADRIFESTDARRS